MYIQPNNETELLHQIASGDEAAFAVLFNTYHQRLGVFVFGWTKSEALAEEIVQDVFMKIWTKREALTEVRKVDDYLYIMARNAAFNCLRQIARERVHRESWETEQGVSLTDEQPDYIPLIEQAVSNLPAQQQKVYYLKHHARMKYGEIGRAMQISPETARKHLSAAIRTISLYVRARLHNLFF